MKKTDYHIHPNYSIDAVPFSIQAYCTKAVKLKLEEICFTTHVEIDPVRRELDNFVAVNGERLSVWDFTWLDCYFTELAQAQERFKGAKLRIKAGLEVGYCPGQEKAIERIVNNYPFDFVLGAIHCLNHISISSKQESPLYFQDCTLNNLRRDYFSTLQAAVESDLFDCIAHLDLYRRYGLIHLGPEVMTIHREMIEPILSRMAKQGMGLEINTSSYRRGLKEFHPTKEILRLAVQAGISVFTVGSDAHTLCELGDNIEAALLLLKEYNLNNHIFTQRQAHVFPFSAANS
ncbi:MAG TPA: histidinol-phosphatase [Firmicutes bacterium]|jgi:histidinol-phosphatase (PHP family)|nr:histidinol-phosphatase [Bacillota bacterium]